MTQRTRAWAKLAIERQCTGCGATFRDHHTRCMQCRATERQCGECGKAFQGIRNRCARCYVIDRQCKACGRTFRGHTKFCKRCRATERECQVCGQAFCGTEKRCWRCQVTERGCENCGQAFRGFSNKYCHRCRWAALPLEERRSRGSAQDNARRAAKFRAEVAGPVPPEVYVAVLASEPCVYCGDPSEHVDHVWPLSRGGPEHEANLVPACAPCNLSKHARLLTEWEPDRVVHGITMSPKVAAEWIRLQEAAA